MAEAGPSRRSGGGGKKGGSRGTKAAPEPAVVSSDHEEDAEPTPKMEGEGGEDGMEVDEMAPIDDAVLRDSDEERDEDDEDGEDGVEMPVVMDEMDEDDEGAMDEDALLAAEAAAIRRQAALTGAAGGGLEALLGQAGLGGAMSAALGGLGGMAQRLKTLLAALKQPTHGDPSAKLIALQELSELLSIASEDTLAGYLQVDPFARELVNIVKGGAGVDNAFAVEQDSVEMMILAARCLGNMMEALPGSSHSVVYAGAVPVLCAKLLEIQFIDLAEQVLIVRRRNESVG